MNRGGGESGPMNGGALRMKGVDGKDCEHRGIYSGDSRPVFSHRDQIMVLFSYRIADGCNDVA